MHQGWDRNKIGNTELANDTGKLPRKDKVNRRLIYGYFGKEQIWYMGQQGLVGSCLLGSLYSEQQRASVNPTDAGA